MYANLRNFRLFWKFFREIHIALLFSRLVSVYFKEKFCVSACVGKSPLASLTLCLSCLTGRDVCLKIRRSEGLVEKVISLVTIDINHSFKR